VCYSLEITAVDPVGMDLLFERFLSEERGEWPDIDLDLPSGEKRERVIQYVYQRFGKLGAAMTANVITYRGRSAAREVGKALGFESPRSKSSRSWRTPGNGAIRRTRPSQFREAGLDLDHPRVRKFFELYRMAQDLPRHLGQHSGGMVICQGQLDSVVPLEPATMPGRVVVQWDKEDCADMGIIKVDLLGLGMMAVIEDCLKLIPEVDGPGAPAAGRSGGFRSPAKGRHHRHVPGGEPRADVRAAAHDAAPLLRHRGAGGHHPARPHRGQNGASLPEPAAGPGAAGLPAPVARTGAANARWACRCSRSSCCGWP
jgi:hypothetical protein